MLGFGLQIVANKKVRVANKLKGENNDPGLLALLTKRSSYDTTAIVRSLTPRRSDLKA